MATLEDLERRVNAAERANTTNVETLKRVAGTLGTVKAIVDDHPATLDDHTKTLERIEASPERTQSEFSAWRLELPVMIAGWCVR